eukprot:182609-Rhodomonas_salina.1
MTQKQLQGLAGMQAIATRLSGTLPTGVSTRLPTRLFSRLSSLEYSLGYLLCSMLGYRLRELLYAFSQFVWKAICSAI